MSVQIDTTSAPHRLIYTVTDPWPTIAEFASLRQRLMVDGHLTESSRALIDVRGVTTPGYHEATSIVKAALKAGAFPLRRGYLVGSAVQFGFARQLQALAPASMEIEIFTSESEALVWLNNRGA
jgi:hypothetical protein